MTTILDIPEVRKRFSPLSVEEYHRLDEYNENGRRTELIRGVVIEKMPKSPLHCTLSARLHSKISSQISDAYTIWKERPLTLADSEPEPDVSITLGDERQFLKAHPTTAELVIEVAVSNPELDRANASLYAEAGVKEYWIVLGEKQQIEVYRRPENGHYLRKTRFGGTDIVQSESIPAVKVQVSELFADLFP